MYMEARHGRHTDNHYGHGDHHRHRTVWDAGEKHVHDLLQNGNKLSDAAYQHVLREASPYRVLVRATRLACLCFEKQQLSWLLSGARPLEICSRCVHLRGPLH
jgi:hypothetical protein